MSIKVLAEDVILKIAAGEVIERPASVVKELIENSIDAGAKNISVEFSENYLKILDDGKGMDSSDLKVCYLRHATSKLSEAEDLFNITSLGFRGEALASVAAVSLMEVTSKTIDGSASKIILEASNEVSFGPISFPSNSGTQIEVKNLFFNTPARKKYMKSDGAEVRAITEVIGSYMLANESIGFKFVNKGKVVINVPSKADLRERFYSVYSKDARSMISLDTVPEKTKMELNEKGISVDGLISGPEIYRKTRHDQILFVNGRLVKSGIIYTAISNAYKGFLNTGEQPLCVLKINVDPKKIDVNVHPTKQEIKFEDDKTVYRAVYYSVLETLRGADLTREVHVEESTQDSLKSFQSTPETNDESVSEKPSPKVSAVASSYSKPEISEQLILADDGVKSEKEEDLVVETKNESLLRVMGIFNREFIVTENVSSKKLSIIDFHAAAEIKNYERLKNEFEGEGIQTQALVEADLVEASLSDAQILIENKDFFKQLGFYVEEFGENSFLLRSVPVLMGRQLTKKVLFDLVEGIKAEKKTNSIEDLKDKILIRMACRASEKAGDELTLSQAQKIIDEMFSLEGNSYNCPHGRPTIIEFSREDLEKMFKRIR